MPSDNLIIIFLIVVGMVLALQLWALFIRKPQQDDHARAVLEERLSAREERLATLATDLEDLQSLLEQEQQTGSGQREQLARLETLLQQERHQHAEKLTLLNEAREQMKLEFAQLANEILEQKGKRFSESSQESLKTLLQPLNERIQQFQKRVEDSYNSEARERFSLQKEIKNLQELNTRISEEAVNLTRALKGETKTQGTWGEVILERVLERSGLKKGSEYDIQVSLRNEDGRTLQPDVIVHLPDGKDVIIDAKVSLVAYERYCSEEDESRKAVLLKEHIRSIRQHIIGLSAKEYQSLEGIKTLDSVMMFLPVEAAFTVAVQEDSELFSEAFDRNILLAGPSTLLAMMRTIQSIWRYEYQNKNAMDIAGRAGKLYDKFVLFTQSLEEIGQRIHQSQLAYDKASRQLSAGTGNLVGQVEKLKDLGARASKQLPQHLLGEEADESEAVDDELPDEN